MHAKPDLRVVLEWKNAGFGSVNAGVIPPGVQRDGMIGHAQDSLERARDMLRSESLMTQPREQARVGRSECPTNRLPTQPKLGHHRAKPRHARTSSTSLGKLARM